MKESNLTYWLFSRYTEIGRTKTQVCSSREETYDQYRDYILFSMPSFISSFYPGIGQLLLCSDARFWGSTGRPADCYYLNWFSVSFFRASEWIFDRPFPLPPRHSWLTSLPLEIRVAECGHTKGPFALGDNDMESLCRQITFLSSSVNSYIGNHATHFLFVWNGCCTYSWRPEIHTWWQKNNVVVAKYERAQRYGMNQGERYESRSKVVKFILQSWRHWLKISSVVSLHNSAALLGYQGIS